MAKKLNDSLRLALQSMSAVLYRDITQELTAAEQEVLRRGGLVAGRTTGSRSIG